MSRSLAQLEAESIAWINMAATVLSLPLFGMYTYATIQDVEDLEFFVNNDPRGQELIVVLFKLGAFLILWIPMSITLQIAASRRDHHLLKSWNIFQVLLIFVIALHLLIQPPSTLEMVFAYIICFVYFLISLWISETLVKEIKQGETESKFMRMDGDVEAEAEAAWNDTNNTVLVDSIEFRSSIEDNNNTNDTLAIEMKKVTKSGEKV